MLEAFRRRRRNREIIDRLWDGLVARARRPGRFQEGGLPDTVMGRFESLGIESFLFLRRCRNDPALDELAQDLVDRFMTDLDHSMRELGVGYLAVPKRMRKLAGRFYARVEAFETPLAERDAQRLADALRTSVYRDAPGGDEAGAEALAADMISGSDWYARLPTDDILAGRLDVSQERPS